MSTTDGLPPDSLNLLKASITSETPAIPASSADASDAGTAGVPLSQATHLIFNTQDPVAGAQHISIPLNQPTRFVSAAQKRPLDLRSVYFCWQNRDESVANYIALTQILNSELKQIGSTETATNLVFAEKLDLVNWLSGADDDSEFIRSLDDNKLTRLEADDAAATARGGEDVEMRDAGLSDKAAREQETERLARIYAGERVLSDRNMVLHGSGKGADYSFCRKHSAAFLKPQKPGSANTTAQANGNGTATLTSNPSLRPAVGGGKPAPNRRPEPIILLSPSASSLLSMTNIKSFLSDGLFTPPPAGTVAPNLLHLTRTLPSISPRPLRFVLVDSPENFRPDYWERVVCVFTTGQAWQFRNYKWQNPAELFSRALGVYVGWQGEIVPETVKGWGRGVLVRGLDKGVRWRDREVVEEVWNAIEERMRAQGWGK